MRRIYAVSICIVAFAVVGFSDSVPQPQPEDAGISFDDIVVESALNVRKPESVSRVPARQVREIPVIYLVAPQGRLYRVKRQFGFQPQPAFGSSSSQANAAAQNQYFGPNGFGGSAANAGAQGFQSQGPLGGFGASATNANTQAFNVGPGGIQGSAGLSGSQAYNLPGGGSIDLTYGQTYAVGPDGRPTTGNAHSINYNKG